MKRVFAFAMVCLIFMQFGMTGAAYAESASDNTDSFSGDAVDSGDIEDGDDDGTASGDDGNDNGGDGEDGGASEGEPDDAQSSGKRIVGIYLLDSTFMAVLARNGDANELALPPQAYCELEDWSAVYVDIDWDLESINTSVPGWQWIQGEVILPDGYAFPDGDLTLQQRVLIYDSELPGAETLASAYAIINNCNIVPLGTDDAARDAFYRTYHIDSAGIEALGILLDRYALPEGTFDLHDELGQSYYFIYPVTYDASLVDMNTVGSYSIFSSVPSYFRYSQNAMQKLSIHVLDPNEVDLRAWKADGFGTISMEWFCEINEPELWVSVDGGEWRHADTLMDDGYNVYEDWVPYNFRENWNTGKTDGLQIIESGLITGHTYEFEVRYENGGLSVNSFVLDLVEGRPLRYGNGGGSRGGSDREETDPPPINPGSGNGPVEPVDNVPDPPRPNDAPPDPIEPDIVEPEEEIPEPSEPVKEIDNPSAPDEELPGLIEADNEAPDSTIPEGEADVTDSHGNEAPPAVPAAAPDYTKGIPSVNSSQKDEPSLAPVSPPSMEAEHSPQIESNLQEQPVDVSEVEAEETSSKSVSGPVSIAIVGAASALGSALIWKLFGKRWVKPR